MPLILLVVLIPIAIIALIPLLLIQRYRVGTSRRPARRWAAWLGVISTAVSAATLLATAAFTNIWVSDAFRYGALGLSFGCVLGLIGVALTRWEPTTRALHYTPSRLLVLFITLIVTARVMFGLYRSFVAAQAGISGHGLIGAFGVDQSLAAGGIVIGYYLAYNVGVIWQLRRWDRRALRVYKP